MNWIKGLINRIRHSYYGIAKVLAFVVAIVLVCLLMPRTGKFKYEFQLSKPWQHETLYAPYSAETDAAEKQVHPVFVFNDNEMNTARKALVNAFDAQWDEHSTLDKAANLDCLLKVYDSIEDQGIVAYDNATSSLDPSSVVTVIRDKVMRTVRYGDFYAMNEATEAVATTRNYSQNFSMAHCVRMCFITLALPSRKWKRLRPPYR